jgi:DNA-binding MarR family transcriptional regulator
MRTKGPNTLYIAAPKLNQLNLLKELAANPHLTQAELARRCDLSVSMVNNYLKELCSLGWLEYHRKTTKTVSYHVTAAGAGQLESAQHELMHEMVDLFVRAKERILSLVLKHRRPRRVILYGSGNLAEIAFHALESAGIDVVGVCDDDASRSGKWFGTEVLDPMQIGGVHPDAIVVAVESDQGTDGAGRSLGSFEQLGIDLIRLNGFTGQSVAPELAEAPQYETVSSH